MKNLIKCVYLAAIILFDLSCAKNESPTSINLCAKGKYLYPWCGPGGPGPQLAVIQVLDSAIGGDFTTLGKKYQNTVLAHTLRESGIDFSGIASSSDSIFYFRYEKNKYPQYICEVGTPPKINIRVTSLLSTPCPTITNP